MNIKVTELGLAKINGQYKSTFKWYVEGDCACGAKREVRYFDNKPTTQDLINSI